ncbi:MAG: methionyl-tRNA formyltransferase [Limisphaerales bacterium]
MNVLFAGSPQFAATILESLLKTQFSPTTVYTQPDRPAGRGRKLATNPVKQLASAHNIAVMQPTSLRTPEAAGEMQALAPDILIVVAYGLILPNEILNLPPLGCINVHASLLPRWRGAAPIERAFMAGDAQTGVSIMAMDAGLDTGPVYLEQAVPISPLETIDQVEANLRQIGSTALLKVLNSIADGTQTSPTPQTDEGANYASKLTSKDRIVDWQLDAASVARQVNALASRMPVRTTLRSKGLQLLAAQPTHRPTMLGQPGEIVAQSDNGFEVQCATNTLLLEKVKLEGKGESSSRDAMNGYPDLFAIGNLLT